MMYNNVKKVIQGTIQFLLSMHPNTKNNVAVSALADPGGGGGHSGHCNFKLKFNLLVIYTNLLII